MNNTNNYYNESLASTSASGPQLSKAEIDRSKNPKPELTNIPLNDQYDVIRFILDSNNDFFEFEYDVLKKNKEAIHLKMNSGIDI